MGIRFAVVRGRIVSMACVAILLCFTPWVKGVQATTVNGIISVLPSNATLGQSSLSVSITLDDNGAQPLPPSNITPDSVTIGSLSGSNISRTDSVVNAVFNIPSNGTAGSYDVIVTFTTPNGQLDVTKTDGFTIKPSGGSLSVVYVNGGSTAGTPDGTSWETAYKDLQDGIDLASLYAAEVWVAQGTYTPPGTSDRSVSIQLKSGVSVYGGFAGTETARSQRDYTTNTTILSGDIGTASIDTDNSYHVVLGKDSATLDGFTITKGYASGEKWNRLGGGLYCGQASPTITNCTFTDNYAEDGGGAYLYYYSLANISNCTFSNNKANYGGAIVARVGADASLSNCQFTGNRAEWRGGAIFIDYGSDMNITGCTFASNTTNGNGGAIYIDDRSSQLNGTYPVISSCTFTSNQAKYRGGAVGLYNSATYPQISNSTFTSNIATAGGGAISCDYYVKLTLSGTITYSGNSGGTGQADLDSDSTSTVTQQ